MKTIADIQKYILEKTGLKTGVRILTGSMKGYFAIQPLFQNGSYQDIPFDICAELKTLLPSAPGKPTFCSGGYVNIHINTGIIDERIKMKSERRPKPIDETTPMKGWGSKNSQLRLDKATRRNAKKMQKGNTARYW